MTTQEDPKQPEQPESKPPAPSPSTLHTPNPQQPGYEDTVKEFTPGSSPGILTPAGPGERSGADYVPAEVRPLMADPNRRLNQYVLMVTVGHGGMGTVWKAWDTKLTRYVAIKILSNTGPENIRRFQREAQMAGRLRHPNIAAIYEVNEVGQYQYLAMDFIDGSPIGKAKLELPQLIESFAKVCDAVDYAHRNDIIHRDLKPQNIMVTTDGEPFVTDFGLAKALSADSSISVTGSIMGTPAYMSPEQAAGDTLEVDARSDIYSLGSTLYTLAVGRQPYEAENASAMLCKICTADPPPPRTYDPKLPAPVEAVIMKAMSRRKPDRYESAREMAADLRRYLSNQRVSAPKVITRRRARPAPAKKKSPVVAILAVVAVAAVAAVLALAGVFSGSSGWEEQSLRLKAFLGFKGFKELSSKELEECRGLIKAMPDAEADGVAGWLEKEARTHLPREVWPPAEWPERGREARKAVAWCRAVERSLQGLTLAVADRFRPLKDRLDRSRKDLEPVVQYVASGAEREWRKRFDALRVKLYFEKFEAPPKEALAELNQTMRAMPGPVGDEAVQWFETQVALNVPKEVWAKPLWRDKRNEAGKLVAWCTALRKVIEGVDSERFGPVDAALSRAVADFMPVAEYVETGMERTWATRFERVQALLALSAFKPLAGDALIELKAIMAEMPEPMAKKALGWFTGQADLIPDEVWPKALWLTKREDARRYSEWGAAAGAVLDAVPEALRSGFDPLQKRLAEVGGRFAPVTAFRGRITLTIYVLPYATVKSFRIGEEFLVRDGAKVDSGSGSLVGEETATPLVIEYLDIGDYTLELELPGLGKKTYTIPGAELKNGERYLFGGNVKAPDALALRKRP